ncbi:MAG: YitT family protein, partial [Bacilli bacterium]
MLKKLRLSFKTPLTAKDKRKIASDLILVILGSLILAFASGIFLVPASINAGGLAGMGIIVDYLFNFSFSIVDIVVGILAVVLFAIGWVFLGT